MDDSEKLRIAIEALENIANFGHAEDCDSRGYAPVYECGCWDISQWELAKDALLKIGQ